MSKRAIIATSLFALAATVSAALAASGDYKAHFMNNWDLDGDGAVTLSEVKERRQNVFAAFDANDDGYIDAKERTAMDDMRRTEHASMGDDNMKLPRHGQGRGHGMGHGMGGNNGNGFGPGKGMGQGQGMGKGQGMGMGMHQGGQMHGAFRMNAEARMHNARMIDADGDGRFSRDEFVGMSERWMARLDTDGDGAITQGDF
jgi:hypothetical protein